MGDIEVYKKPSWNDYFFGIMDAVSKRGTCGRGRSGCIIVNDNRVLCTGYVGSPPGFGECDNVGHLFELRVFPVDGEISKSEIISKIENSEYSIHCVRTTHAEVNGIYQAAKFGIKLDGSDLYCRMTPCRTCAEAIIQVGIKNVFCERKYQKATYSEQMFKSAGVNILYKYNEEQKY
jgi:dCMP deaminase